jgi:hypothetical protein
MSTMIVAAAFRPGIVGLESGMYVLVNWFISKGIIPMTSGLPETHEFLLKSYEQYLGCLSSLPN